MVLTPSSPPAPLKRSKLRSGLGKRRYMNNKVSPANHHSLRAFFCGASPPSAPIASRSRSSGSPPPERIAAAYTAATSSALVVALGMQAAGKSLEARLAGGGGGASAQRSQLVRSGVRLTVPMLAVAIGSVVNLYFTRQTELAEGVVLSTEEGLELGHSHVAAHQGLAKCATTRVLWTIALLTVTPIASGAVLAAVPASLAARHGVRFALDLAVSFGVIWAAVPL